MKRLVIAIDCDDVLVPTTQYIVDTYNSKYGTAVTYERAHESQNEQWRASRSEVFDRMYAIQLEEEFGQIEPFTGAVQAVAALSREHELHLVTARAGVLLAVTANMLDRYFDGCFDRLEHIGPSAAKGDICRSLRADVLIDDNLRHLQHAAECGIEHCIWFGDYPWSRYGEAPSSTVRCADWTAVSDQIGLIASE